MSDHTLSSPLPPEEQILIYRDGVLHLRVRVDGQTVWLPQRLIAELFQVTVPTVNEHLSNVYAEGELGPGPTIRKFRIVQTEGSRQVSREVDHYSLDAILAAATAFGNPGTVYRLSKCRQPATALAGAERRTAVAGPPARQAKSETVSFPGALAPVASVVMCSKRHANESG